MLKTRHLVALFILMAIAGCSAHNPSVTWDPQFDFADVRTYDWAPKEPETGVEIAYEAVDRAVKRVVDAHMSRAGFTRSSDNPSVRLNYWVGSEEVAQITDAAYYGPGWGAYWAYGWYGPDGVNISQYQPGSITVDVVSTDPSIGLIWRGIAGAELDLQGSPQRIEGAVEDALSDILDDFPPEDDD